MSNAPSAVVSLGAKGTPPAGAMTGRPDLMRIGHFLDFCAAPKREQLYLRRRPGRQKEDSNHTTLAIVRSIALHKHRALIAS